MTKLIQDIEEEIKELKEDISVVKNDTTVSSISYAIFKREEKIRELKSKQ